MVHFAELFRQSVTVPPLSFRSLAARLSPPAGGWGLPAFAVRLKQSGITALEQFHQQLTFEGPTRLRIPSTPFATSYHRRIISSSSYCLEVSPVLGPNLVKHFLLRDGIPRLLHLSAFHLT